MKTVKNVTEIRNEELDNLIVLGLISQMSRILNDIKSKTPNTNEEIFSLVAGYAEHLNNK